MSRPVQRASIIAVGSEMLTPLRVDTNSLYITERLNELGIEVVAKTIVGDSREELDLLLQHALARADLVVLSGGLGPTDDDVTREVVAARLGRPLDEDPAITARIQARFAARGWTMPELNRRQALVPRGATVLPNANGTAPGLWIESGDRVVVLLPGPPRELKPMIDAVVAGPLAARVGGERLARRIIRITGRTESHVEELMQPLYRGWAAQPIPVAATILAALGQIELHLTVRLADAAAASSTLDAAVGAVVGALGRDVYSTDGRAIEEVVGALLRARRYRIALAESCTGGLATSKLTDVPGSSTYVERAVVAYSNEAKQEWLGVPAELLAEQGAVSEPVAVAMATGVRERARVDVGVGITGVAGPGGGTAQKPVGMVCLAVAWPDGTRVRTARFIGGREQVKGQSAHAALDMVRRVLVP